MEFTVTSYKDCQESPCEEGIDMKAARLFVALASLVLTYPLLLLAAIAAGAYTSKILLIINIEEKKEERREERERER